MPDVPEYRAADNAHPPAALIKAALLHNNLPVEEGFSAFDVDQDNKLSFEDVWESCNKLQLGIPEDAIREFHRRASGGDKFLDLEGWKRVLSAPEGLDAVLESRGLNTSELPLETAALSVKEMLNLIKAALLYNSLSLEAGFYSFDIDGDQQISLSDLNTAAERLQLGLSAADVSTLHSHLDGKKNGVCGFEQLDRVRGECRWREYSTFAWHYNTTCYQHSGRIRYTGSESFAAN